MGAPRVHVMGGESTGWALDADVATTRTALAACGVELVSLEEAEVVHAVWETPVLSMAAGRLAGKRILCHLPNDLCRTFAQACMARHSRVGLWIPISRLAEADCARLGMKHRYVPYAVDTSLFTAGLPGGGSRESLRKQWKIPLDRYVIGNFMRDSDGADISRPKPQKGVEMFVDILAGLRRLGVPIHVLLAGPRRHWVRGELKRLDIPFTFVGQVTAGDDNHINILPPQTVNLLYHASDLHLVSSRWEGGPRAVLEAAAANGKILCTPVGLAPDVLEPASMFTSADEAIARIAEDVRTGRLDATVAPQRERVMRNHTPAANAERFRSIYEAREEIPAFQPCSSGRPASARPSRGNLRGALDACLAPLLGRSRHQPGRGMTVNLWHEFHKPPYGGGNQFMLALKPALERRGVRIRVNESARPVDLHLCNSAWFNVDVLRAASRRSPLRMVHRIDGPVSAYRGTDRAEDDRIFSLNLEFATATVFQSFWCFSRSLAMGYRPAAPVVIHNAVDGRVFHPADRRPADQCGRIRLISAAWSDNPRKGLDIFTWLDEHLDFSRFEYTFVGRIQAEFRQIRHVPAQPSARLARLLREQDLFISASRSEPCSNALLEAMSCGLPALYMNDGGNPELVQLGGLPFNGVDDILAQLDRLAENLDHYRVAVSVPRIDDIALRYIDLFREVLDAPGAGLE